jgi:pyruvate dehydrogenase phosphatase
MSSAKDEVDSVDGSRVRSMVVRNENTRNDFDQLASILALDQPTTIMSARLPMLRALRTSGSSVSRLSGLLRPTRGYAPSFTPPGSNSTVRRNALLAGGLLATSAILYYYEVTTSAPSSAVSSLLHESFTINVGGQTHTFTHLGLVEAEKKLTANEETREISRPGNPVFKVDRSWLGSNEPCEDRMAADLVPRHTLPGGPKAPVGQEGEGSSDMLFASVLDGHAGDATSILLSNVLHPTLSVALAGLQAGNLPKQAGWRAILDWTNPMSWIGGNVWTPANIAQTIQSA